MSTHTCEHTRELLHLCVSTNHLSWCAFVHVGARRVGMRVQIHTKIDTFARFHNMHALSVRMVTACTSVLDSASTNYTIKCQ